MSLTDEFTIEEKIAINQLRNEIEKKTEFKSKTLDDDLIVFKFLKGCSFKQNEAERMLTKHIQWRMEHQIDRILIDYKAVEVLELYLSQSFLGFAKDGCVVRYSAAGNVDIQGIFKSASLYDIFKCVVHLIESDVVKTKEQTEKMGKPVSQFVYIYNLEHLTISKALDKKNLNFMMLGSSLYQENYPERLKSIFVINAPAVFTIAFSIMKSVLSIGLLKKVNVFGDYGWKEALLEVIDADVLPSFLGGTRTDPDGNPLCNTFVNHGYLVPEKYFLLNNKVSFKNLEKVQQMTVKRQTREEIDINVEKSGSFIEWEFEITSKDIGFGLSYELDSEIEDLIPVHRTETPDSPQSGMYYCERAGKYIIIFDNSYSLMTSKEVFYKIVVNCKSEESSN